MKILSFIMEELKVLFNGYYVLMIIAIGLFTFFVDRKKLEKNNKKKDAKIAKSVGLLYIIGAPILFIALKFM